VGVGVGVGVGGNLGSAVLIGVGFGVGVRIFFISDLTTTSQISFLPTFWQRYCTFAEVTTCSTVLQPEPLMTGVTAYEFVVSVMGWSSTNPTIRKMKREILLR